MTATAADTITPPPVLPAAPTPPAVPPAPYTLILDQVGTVWAAGTTEEAAWEEFDREYSRTDPHDAPSAADCEAIAASERAYQAATKCGGNASIDTRHGLALTPAECDAYEDALADYEAALTDYHAALAAIVKRSLFLDELDPHYPEDERRAQVAEMLRALERGHPAVTLTRAGRVQWSTGERLSLHRDRAAAQIQLRLGQSRWVRVLQREREFAAEQRVAAAREAVRAAEAGVQAADRALQAALAEQRAAAAHLADMKGAPDGAP